MLLLRCAGETGAGGGTLSDPVTERWGLLWAGGVLQAHPCPEPDTSQGVTPPFAHSDTACGGTRSPGALDGA